MEQNVRFEWRISVPIFKNPLILKQLFLALGIPFGILIVIFLIFFPSPERFYASGMVAALILLGVLLVFAIYGGRYDVHYIIDDGGILCENSPKSAKRAKAVGNAAFIAGLATGNLTAAGAGAMSASRTKSYIKRKNVRKLKANDKGRYLLINGGFAENIAIFCGGNYEAVKAFLDTGRCA